jgi:signal transduction histidine kinase
MSARDVLSSLWLDGEEHSHQHYLIDAKGQFLSHPETVMAWGAQLGHGYTAADEFGAAAADIQSARSSYMDNVRGQVVTHAAVLPDKSVPARYWKIVAAAPRDAILAPVTRLQRTVTIVLLGALAVAIVAGHFLSRYWIVGPIHSLAETVIRFGSGDHEARGKAGSDEIGQLSEAFNAMGEAVRAGKEALERRNAIVEAQAKSLEEALASQLEYNELQQQFVSMASHEFRTPLAIIDSAAQRMTRLADKDALTQQEAAKRIEKVRVQVKRLLQLIENTLSITRIEQGHFRFEAEACDIGQIVEEVCNSHQETAKTHTISCSLDGAPEMIRADAGAIRQILSNLLSNAVKYSPGASQIQVGLYRDGVCAVLQVRDFGMGIDENDLPRMFKRFFRARNSAGIVGTGIGLHLVKQLAEMHDGTVSVASKRGEGSTFTVRLPVSGPKARMQDPSPAERTAGGGLAA